MFSVWKVCTGKGNDTLLLCRSISTCTVVGAPQYVQKRLALMEQKQRKAHRVGYRVHERRVPYNKRLRALITQWAYLGP